jgi:spectinomycin phosphotransferase
MILEHPDLPAAFVGAAVEQAWGVDVTAVEPVDRGSRSWHWLLGDDGGPQWFATLDAWTGTEERRARIAAYEAGARLAQRLSFAVGPVHTRDARVAIDLAPGLLLSVAPFLEGTWSRPGSMVDDADRSVLATMAGHLHRQPPPGRPPVWRPRIGGLGLDLREELEQCLAQEVWSGGPWSVPAGRLVTEARAPLETALRRFALLGAAVAGHVDRWVVTHGELLAGNLVRTPDGHRLVGWGSTARAPRERDLGAVLSDSGSDRPWCDYRDAGGDPEPLSADTVEVFVLQRRLSEVAECALRLSRPHEDTADERRRFERLEKELCCLLGRSS